MIWIIICVVASVIMTILHIKYIGMDVEGRDV